MKKVAYLLLALALVACSGKKQQASLPSSNEFAVETISPQTADLNTTYPAIIKGVQDVEIRSKVSGNIVKQLVDEVSLCFKSILHNIVVPWNKRAPL